MAELRPEIIRNGVDARNERFQQTGAKAFEIGSEGVCVMNGIYVDDRKERQEIVKDAVIYQINLRVFTKEGTLAAAEKFLPEIADTGANIVYLSPFMESDSDPDPACWSVRQKISLCGNPRNPYRIADYNRIDPEYGTDADLKSFVKTAHGLKLKVMVDLVYAHAGPSFGKRHPDYVQVDESGRMKLSNYKFCLLNFDSPGAREYLWSNMEYWVREFDVDCYRCDIGGRVPLDFWAEGRRRVEKIKKPFIMLNECEIQDRKEDQDEVFDINYCHWWTMYSLPDIFRGGMPAKALEYAWHTANSARPGAVVTRALEHHDSANDMYYARVEKISSAKCEAVYVLCYAVDGVPFLYNGCEHRDTARHSIFGNPGQFHIDRSEDRAERSAFLRKLAGLHRNESALRDGSMQWLENSAPEALCVWLRTAPNGEKIFGAVNLANETIHAKCPAGAEFLKGSPLIERGTEYGSDDNLTMEANGFILIKCR